MLSPQKVEWVNPNANGPVYPWSRRSAAPWEAGHPLSRKEIGPKQVWAHRVFCSVYPYAPVRDLVVERLGGEVEDERFGELDACLFAFLVNEKGRPVADSFVLVSAAWGASRMLSPGPSDPELLGEGFAAAAAEAKRAWMMAVLPEELARRAPAALEGVETEDAAGGEVGESAVETARMAAPLTWEQVAESMRAVAAAVGAAESVVTQEVRVAPIRVSRKNGPSVADLGVVNSFFLGDLTRVAGEVEKGATIGAALEQYLSLDPDEKRRSARVDLRESEQVTLDLLDPRKFPQGKWPTPGHHALSFSQQVALNAALEQLQGGSGLYAVNGPPGTGKTTLLRDLTAAVVVERARRLAELGSPAQAFERFEAWGSGYEKRRIPIWRDRLRGFELVVASSNNGAVENVTKEIPGEEAVDPRWRGELDYFRHQATRTIGEPAWALVAACLGKKENRRDFVKRCWRTDRSELQTGRSPPPELEGLEDKLKAWKGSCVDWKRAVQRFKGALREEGVHRARMMARADALRAVLAERRELKAAEAEPREVAEERALAEAKLAALAPARHRAEVDLAEVRGREAKHALTRRPLLERLRTLGRADRPWRMMARALRENRVRFEKELAELSAEEPHLAEKCAALRSLEASLTREVLERRARLERSTREAPAWATDEAKRERSVPWDDPEWNKARVRVFLEALELHRAFIQAEAQVVRKGLEVAMDVLDGKTAGLSPEIVGAAWTMLHFVVPVGSTTFASFERMFAKMGRESIGWLLIDEAGQAAPQLAAGAIWRSRRVVAVGDPQQLEPVVELPDAVKEALRGRYELAAHWVPRPSSVQHLADRSARYGMTFTVADDEIWVGAPLRLHRRCEEPMFGIAKEIAYGELMIHADHLLSRPESNLPKSCWLDVPGDADGGHWIPAQGTALAEALADLVALGTKPEDIIVVSPFRTVASQIPPLCARPAYSGVRYGTIHTVQGKEADVVLLVLGGDPNKKGARRFVTEKPNLVNVAVTRAKRRLYVIGDHASWKDLPYVNVVAARLLVRGSLRP